MEYPPKRVIPSPAAVSKLVRLRSGTVTRSQRVRRAQTIADLRRIAQRYTPHGPFEFVTGGSDDEITIGRNAAAYRNVVFEPSVLVDVTNVDISAEVFGERYAAPFGIAPVGFQRAMRHEGEYAGIEAAARADIPFVLSLMASVAVDEVPSVSPAGARNWFQLAIWKDREKTLELIERAKAGGFRALFITVDTPVAGNRVRDYRNGMTLPPSFSPSAVFDVMRHPGWLYNFLTTEAPGFANLPASVASQTSVAGAGQVAEMFDLSFGFDDLAWVKAAWGGPIAIKGVLSPDDARRAADAGVDGIVISNHGARQLDRAPATFDVLGPIAEAVGDRIMVMIDGGMTHGNDIIAALCLGADFTFVGKAYMYGLMAGGLPGVQRAIEILTSEIHRSMKLLGASSVAELGPDRIRSVSRLLERS